MVRDGSGILPCQFLDLLEDSFPGDALEPAQHPEASKASCLLFMAHGPWPIELSLGASSSRCGVGSLLGLKHSKVTWESLGEGEVARGGCTW